MSHSPIIKKKAVEKQSFDFPRAMVHLLQGLKVTREAWNNKDEYFLIKFDRLCVHHVGEDKIHALSPLSLVDMEAKDWMLK